MERKFSSIQIQKIITLINNWSESKITWDELCKASSKILGRKPTRQALCAHSEISGAYLLKKKKLKKSSHNFKMPVSIKIATITIENLRDEVQRLKKENENLCYLFSVMQYNARLHGLSKEDHLAPIPTINRRRNDCKRV
ncbi:hypothetical protein RH66_000996 [Salmonella enterica subsp. enterica]|nr:hypothetical protein [Salmonella enterica subsp. enterica]